MNPQACNIVGQRAELILNCEYVRVLISEVTGEGETPVVVAYLISEGPWTLESLARWHKVIVAHSGSLIRRHSGNPFPDHQRVNMVCSLVRLHRLQIAHMPHD